MDDQLVLLLIEELVVELIYLSKIAKVCEIIFSTKYTYSQFVYFHVESVWIYACLSLDIFSLTFHTIWDPHWFCVQYGMYDMV